MTPGEKTLVNFDHAAMPPISSEALRIMNKREECRGNPGSVHHVGVQARIQLEESRRKLAHVYGAFPEEVIFTGGATESLALAIGGALLAWRRGHPGITPRLLVGPIEHDAVRAAVAREAEHGAIVELLPLLPDGKVDPKGIEQRVTSETVLVILMTVNNEIGTIQPVRDLGKRLRRWRKDVRGATRVDEEGPDDRYPLLLSDAAQSGWIGESRLDRLGADLIALSSYKCGGPSGAGALLVRRGTPILPLIPGGGQEGGRRGGTENIPAIAGFASVAVSVHDERDAIEERINALRERFLARLRECVPAVHVNAGSGDTGVSIVSLTIPGVDHEFLAIALDQKGFLVGTRSACGARNDDPSHVLLALRAVDGTSLPPEALRVSFGPENTDAEVEAFMNALVDILETLVVSPFPVM
jgi:cysteine desulfurase